MNFIFIPARCDALEHENRKTNERIRKYTISYHDNSERWWLWAKRATNSA
jgi:hypothetical protein